METSRRAFLLGSSALALSIAVPARLDAARAPLLEIDTPMPPPEWALLERAVLDAHLPACEAFFERYYDHATGFFRAIERWGGDDGPDDAIENVNDWPHLYQLGGAARIRSCTNWPTKVTSASIARPGRRMCRSRATACTSRNFRS